LKEMATKKRGFNKKGASSIKKSASPLKKKARHRRA